MAHTREIDMDGPANSPMGIACSCLSLVTEGAGGYSARYNTNLMSYLGNHKNFLPGAGLPIWK